METIEMVEEFHSTFGCHVEQKPKIPAPVSVDACEDLKVLIEVMGRSLRLARNCARTYNSVAFLRIALIQEELIELALGILIGNPVTVLDGLTDLQYVLDGTYLACGLQDYKDTAFREVHRSNMTKDPNLTSPEGKIQKGFNYEPPDLAGVLVGVK